MIENINYETECTHLKNKIPKNNEIEDTYNFKMSEKEFQSIVKKELENSILIRIGKNCKGKNGEYQLKHKKNSCEIIKVTKDTQVKKGGKPDILIYHDGIDGDYDHKLANPFKIELKTDRTWKESFNQAIRYKVNAEKKYGVGEQEKWLEVAVSSPSLFFKGAFNTFMCKEHDHTKCIVDCGKIEGSIWRNMTCQQYDMKRLFWKSGVGLLEYNPRTKCLELTFNEGDQFQIKKVGGSGDDRKPVQGVRPN